MFDYTLKISAHRKLTTSKTISKFNYLAHSKNKKRCLKSTFRVWTIKFLKLNKTQCGVLLKFLNKHVLYYKTGQNKKKQTNWYQWVLRDLTISVEEAWILIGIVPLDAFCLFFSSSFFSRIAEKRAKSEIMFSM